MKKIIRAIKAWWNGKDTFHRERCGYGDALPLYTHSKHWTSNLAHWIVSLFTNPERRSTFLAVLGFTTFLFMLLKYFTNTDADQNTTNPQRDNREPNTQIHTSADQGKG